MAEMVLRCLNSTSFAGKGRVFHKNQAAKLESPEEKCPFQAWHEGSEHQKKHKVGNVVQMQTKSHNSVKNVKSDWPRNLSYFKYPPSAV